MNEIPHPGFDKPEKYETFTTTNDLEEAAWDCVLDSVDVNNPVLLPKYKELLTYLFIAGAKWQKEQDEKELSEKIASAYQLGLADKEKQMLKEAVEGFIFQPEDYYPKELIARYDGELKQGDKVRIIIVKE